MQSPVATGHSFDVLYYCVTVHVDEPVADDWLAWMQSAHVPDVLATGYFSRADVCRILEPQQEGKRSFEIRYACTSRADYDAYQRDHAPRLQADHRQRYEGKFAASRAILESVAGAT